jgi:hypothetical protein
VNAVDAAWAASAAHCFTECFVEVLFNVPTRHRRTFELPVEASSVCQSCQPLAWRIQVGLGKVTPTLVNEGCVRYNNSINNVCVIHHYYY